MPWHIAVLVAAFALAEPLTHAWFLYAPPRGLVPTGLTTGDSGHHLVCMRAMASGFDSPFATCESPLGARSFRYFAPPLFTLYAIVGEIGRWLRANPPLWLGIANGVGGALYLLAVWRFFVRAVPDCAVRAFYFFTLGGGLGGAAYIAAWVCGATDGPHFEQHFQRFAWYELIEGQHLSPLLLYPRLYYTLPLALGFAALTILIKIAQGGSAGFPARETNNAPAVLDSRVGAFRVSFAGCKSPAPSFTALLILMSAFLNVRLGPLFAIIAVLFLAMESRAPARARMVLGAIFAGGAALGSASGAMMISLSPSYGRNAAALTGEAMRLLPFLTQTIWLLPLAGIAVAAAWRDSGTVPRRILGIGALYLFFYAALYMGYQAYYGNWLYGGESRGVAIFVSRIAAIATILGGIVLIVIPAKAGTQARWSQTWVPTFAGMMQVRAPKWIFVWLLLFTVASLSAWGNWWLATSPQRAMVLMGPPLAIAAALGLDALWPLARRAAFAFIVACGIASSAVGILFFQGPLGGAPGSGAFAYLRYGLMQREDAQLMEQLSPGTVLVPGWPPIAFGEILAQRPGVRVLGGPGAMNLGELPLDIIQAEVDRFFKAGHPTETREAVLKRWCVDFVYCPATCPVAPGVVEELRHLPALEEIAAAGQGVVFRVKP